MGKKGRPKGLKYCKDKGAGWCKLFRCEKKGYKFCCSFCEENKDCAEKCLNEPTKCGQKQKD